MLNFLLVMVFSTRKTIGMYRQYCDVNIGLFVYLKPPNQPLSSINSVEKPIFGETATSTSVHMLNDVNKKIKDDILEHLFYTNG